MSLLERVLQLKRKPTVPLEHDLFSCTLRFLYNEERQRSVRYLPFNVSALMKEATKAVGAEQCVEVQKLAEGAYNKVFLLKFNNDKDVIARLPTKLVPPYFATSSEVATMDFARNILKLPVPQVLAWSATANNPVGAEYIIMERCPGVEAGSRWEDLKQSSPLRAAEQVVEMEKIFARNIFSKTGGIYYTADLPQEQRKHPLLVDGASDVVQTANERFSIGPSPDWRLWKGERASLKGVDRGPWSSPVAHIQASIRLAQEWIRNHAKDHMYPASFSIVRNMNIDHHLDLLDQFHSMVPHILPPDELCKPVLWHTDLNLRNVMLDPLADPTSRSQISGVLDWQHMLVAPFCLQNTDAQLLDYSGPRVQVLSGFRYPVIKPEYDGFPEGSEEQKEAADELRQAKIYKYYQVVVSDECADRRELQSHEFAETIKEATRWASHTWLTGPQHLQDCMYRLASNWDKVARDGAPLPANVDIEALRRAQLQYERFVQYEARVEMLAMALDVGQDGAVDTEKYEDVKARSDRARRSWDEEELELGGPYPFQEGAPCWFVGG